MEVSKPDEIVDIDEILDQFNDLGYEIALTGNATDIFDGMIEEHPARVAMSKETFRDDACSVLEMS